MFEKLVATFQQGEENCYSDRIKLKIELNTSKCIFLYLKSSYSMFFFHLINPNCPWNLLKDYANAISQSR